MVWCTSDHIELSRYKREAKLRGRRRAKSVLRVGWSTNSYRCFNLRKAKGSTEVRTQLIFLLGDANFAKCENFRVDKQTKKLSTF